MVNSLEHEQQQGEHGDPENDGDGVHVHHY
jgi:hypothetical protein